MGFTTFRLMRERAELARRNAAKAASRQEPLKESRTESVSHEPLKTALPKAGAVKEQPKEAARSVVKVQPKKRD